MPVKLHDRRSVGAQVRSGLWIAGQVTIAISIVYLLVIGFTGFTDRAEHSLVKSCLAVALGSALLLAMTSVWRWMIAFAPAGFVILGILKSIFSWIPVREAVFLVVVTVYAVMTIALVSRLRKFEINWPDRCVLLLNANFVMMAVVVNSRMRSAACLAVALFLLALPVIWHGVGSPPRNESNVVL